jgi:hypothetical protein
MADLYELIVEYKGTKAGAIDFAREIKADFSCEIVINRIDKNGTVIEPLIEYEDKVDTRG